MVFKSGKPSDDSLVMNDFSNPSIDCAEPFSGSLLNKGIVFS